MSGNSTENDETDSGQSVDRRAVLKAAGAGAVSASVFSGVASAWEGKGISWIAFCGCDPSQEQPCIEFTAVEDGELVGLTYIENELDSSCTVYYKAGRNIYRHDVDIWDESDNGKTIDTANAGSEDPVLSRRPSDSRDPCGCIDGTDPDCGSRTGLKLEEKDILSGKYDCD